MKIGSVYLPTRKREDPKKIRLAISFSTTGYYFEAVAMLRTVYELNKGINAINKKAITVDRYLGQIDSEFMKIPKDERAEAIEKYTKKVSSIVDNFDDKDIPKDIKPSLKTFKRNMHYSVHKAYSSLLFYLEDFRSAKNQDLFMPDKDLKNFELAANDITFMIVMFLKNWMNTKFYKDDQFLTIRNLVDFEEKIYMNMPKKFHSDIMKYIKFKYS